MRRELTALTGVVIMLSATACGGGSESGGDGGSTEITVGAIPIVDTAPLFLGQDQGFFEERGIDLNIETTSGGAAAVPGVVSGNFEFAFGNVTSLIIGREEGLPLKTVTNGVTSAGKQGGDFSGIVVPEGSDIETPADLEGAEISVNNLQNIGDTTVRNSVRKDGGDPDDLEFIELPFPDAPAALENGRVDAAWVVEPFLTQAKQDGATEIASNFVDADPDLSVATYFTSEKQIAENPELVDDFTAAMNESLAYADENPDEVRRILGDYTEIDAGLIEEIRLPRWPEEVNRGSVATIAELMAEDGLVKDVPNLDELYR